MDFEKGIKIINDLNLYKILCNELLAYCQREDILSTGTDKFYEELEEITGIERQLLEDMEI